MSSHGRVAYQPKFPVQAGDFTNSGVGLAAGTDVPLSPVRMGTTSDPLLAWLCIQVTVDAETNLFTLAGRWQVSQDKATWYDVAHGAQNAASVVLATGTAGADALVSKGFSAPEAVEAWPWARFVFTTGGATSTTSDTYSAQYAARTLIYA